MKNFKKRLRTLIDFCQLLITVFKKSFIHTQLQKMLSIRPNQNHYSIYTILKVLLE